jgi:hypothetical protein
MVIERIKATEAVEDTATGRSEANVTVTPNVTVNPVVQVKEIVKYVTSQLEVKHDAKSDSTSENAPPVTW